MAHSPSIPFPDSSPVARARHPMKPSGVPWIGEIPAGWKTNTVFQIFTQVKNKNSDLRERNLLSLSYGKIKRKNIETTEGLLPESFDGYNIIEADDIVLRLTDLQNDQRSLRVGIATERGIVTSAYVTLRNRSHSLAKYLYYFLYAFDISKGFYGMGGGIRQGLNWDGLKWVKILSPTVDEQRRIAAYLDAECARIDSIIEKTRASLEEYKKLKQSVITEAVTKGIRKGRAMKESGIAWIGEIPEEWEIRPLKAYIDILPGYAFPSGNFDVENGVRLLRGINVAPDSIRWDETVYWNQPINEPIKQFELFENDLVVGLDRPWISEGTRVAFVTKKDLPCLLLQRVCRIRPKAGVDIRFVYHAIAGKMFEEALSTDTTGVSVPHISTKQIQNYLIAVPPIQEQKEICAFLANQSCAIDGVLARKQSLISALETYKKSLIYEVVTGKKEVPA